MTTSIGTGSRVEHVHPDAILIEDNIREAVHLDDGFVASIREHGVIQPVLAVRNTDGTLSVRDGQRRTLGARAAGISSIPAYVVDAGDDRALRIIQQIIANDQRAAITEAERVEAFHQLALEGLSVAAIAKRTGHSKDRIKASVTIAASNTATEALANSAVTLDAALLLAEFDGDHDATAYLLDVATDRPHQLVHAAQRLRDDRARSAIVARAVAALHEQGTPTAVEGDEYQRLTALTDAADDAETRPELDVHAHGGCDGHAVLVTAPWNGSGDPILTPVCTQPDKHRQRWAGSVRQPQSGPMTEEQKAERREVIASNKAWDSAETVRREWLTTLLSRKTLPKDATQFAARVAATSGADLDKGRALAHTFLGAEAPTSFHGNALPSLASAQAKAGHVLLALALAAVEQGTGRHTWRNPHDGLTRDYFTRIAAWGYTLSDIEQTVARTDH
ncbi:ParB/RepB/Spo0J family partition protein [Agromyces ramosus]|nr:ParB N-terminal domain-containing protein [Agromyces ramosus]